MKYETRMKFDKHSITGQYVVDDMVYIAELAIQSPGFCSGMAGYEANRVGVSLSMQESKAPVGYVAISFPLLMGSDRAKPGQMLEPLLEKGFTGNFPPVRKFTPYAESEIERVVTEFIRQRASFVLMGLLLDSISVSVGVQVSCMAKQ
ncbi:MAG: hypothetical protein EOM68_11830 [Spirochaetia bacterium]|nr:hypothetical protein [Spirochaetia bacterium]